MLVTWDDRKREGNILKHGLDFADVEDGFDFDDAMFVTTGNDRVKAIGVLEGKLAVLIFRPLGSEAISLIPLRPASKKERQAYEARQ